MGWPEVPKFSLKFNEYEIRYTNLFPNKIAPNGFYSLLLSLSLCLFVKL